MSDLNRFTLREGVLPPDGTKVTVIFKLVE